MSDNDIELKKYNENMQKLQGLLLEVHTEGDVFGFKFRVNHVLWELSFALEDFGTTESLRLAQRVRDIEDLQWSQKSVSQGKDFLPLLWELLQAELPLTGDIFMK